MAFEKKIWKDRIAEYINRRLLTFEDGSTKLVTVARDEGTISQEGDPFSAAMMNDLENRIQNEFDSQNLSLNDCLKSVSDGKSSIASAITNNGVTTAPDATFETLTTKVQELATNRYDVGRSQGRSDVTGSPNSYGLYTGDQYNANYNNGYNAGKATNYSVKQGSVNVGAADENFHTITIDTGLSSISYYLVKGYVAGNDNGNANNITSSSVYGGRITVRVYARQYCSNMVDYLAVGR